LDRLVRAHDTGRLHHALLFEGPPGVGKHTLARRLAMAVNCLAPQGPSLLGPPVARPCGVCTSCRQILAGTHPDVITIVPDPEKASQTIAVDQIREVVRMSGFHRHSAARRVVIVDPAEAMLPAAANALLKTLEEPNAGTGFVLIASHGRALLPTIVSRCQRIRLGAVPEPELAAWLAERGHPDAVRLARLSMGCPGHALRLAEGELAERAALRDAMVGAVSGDLGALYEFSERLCKGSRQEWSPRVDATIAVLEDLLRDASIVATASSLPLLDDEIRPLLDDWATRLWPEGISRIAEAIADTREQMAVNVAGRTLLDALMSRVRSELGRAPAA
jgi:DNA polymerase-3 subunit delta'